MRVIRRRNVLGVVVVAAVAFAAACGGSDSGSDSSEQTVDEFIAAADDVCRNFDAQFEAIPEPQSAEEFQPALETAAELQGEQLMELQALDPPEDVADPWNEAIGVLTVTQSRTEDAVEDLQGGADPQAVATEYFADLDESDARLDELAAEIGLMECGDAENASTTTDEPTTTDDTLTDDTTTTDSTPTTGQTGDVQRYLTDVGAASQALISFGEILQNVSSPSDLEASADEAQGQLDEFDTAIAQLDGYTLDDSELEEQRAGIVAAAPDVSDTLRRFVDAAAAGDLSAVQSLLPEVTSALTNFQQAAAGNP